MKIKLLAIGKTDNKNLQALLDDYIKRLGFYISFNFEVIPDIKNSKNLSETQQKITEGNEILKRISKADTLILLDEKGKSFSSILFSTISSKKK